MAGTASRLYENPDLAITGNDPVFAGIARWAIGLSGSLAAALGPGTQQEYAGMIDETVEDAYSSMLTGLLGYTPAPEDYNGPVPESLKEDKAREFLRRINAEATLEGRNAILIQVEQESRDRDAISRAGIAKLLTVGLLSLPFDESFWIDLFVTKGALKINRVQQMARMHKIIGAAGLGAVGAGVSGGIREAILFKGQYSRTADEVLQNIKIEAAFGGLLGAAVGTMSTTYRAAVRARYGADNVHDAVIKATDSIASNVANNRGLSRRVNSLLDAFQADRNIDEARLDSVLDEVLDGAGNRNIVELVGLRKGTWRNSLLNKFFFLTPNIRFASSRLRKPRELIDQLTDTGLAKTGSTGGTSLERLKILMEVQQDAARMETSDIFRLAQSEGANIKDETVFDRAVEVLYRRDPSGQFDVPDRIESTLNGTRVNILEMDEAINAKGKAALQKATKKFAEEQAIWDMIGIHSGLMDANSMKKIRKFYKDAHGENFVHRIIDREGVALDTTGATDAVMRGMEDLQTKMTPRYQAELSAKRDELLRVEASRNSTNGAEITVEVDGINLRIAELEKELLGLVPSVSRARGIVETWATSVDGYVRPSMGSGERTVLIKDEFIEPYLIQSVEAQRSAFYSNNGLKGVAFRKLGSRESLKYTKRSLEIHERMDELEVKIREATTDNVRQRHNKELQDLLEEVDVITNAARLYTDIRLATLLNDAEVGVNLQKVRVLERKLLAASRANNRANFLTLRGEFNALSKDFVEVHRISDTGKAQGQIAEHKDILLYRPREDPSIGMDVNLRAALLEDPTSEYATAAIRLARKQTIESRKRITEIEIGDNASNRNFRMEASMKREVIANGDTAKDMKELERIVKDLRVINERIFGNRGASSSDPFKSLGPLFRNYNYMTSMGQVTLSSFPDIAMGVFTSGVGPYVSSIYRYSRHVVQRMMSDASPDERYFMMDMTHSLEANATGARVREIMQFDRAGPQSYTRRKKSIGRRLTEASRTGSQAMTRYSLLGSWNGFWKAVNNGAAASRVGRIANKLGSGRNIGKSDKRFLEMLSLNEVDVRDMNVLYRQFGETESTGLGSKFYYTMSQNWQGAAGNLNAGRVAQLKSRLNGALSRNSDLSIITPGVGSLPSIADRSEGFSMIFQFKRFFFTATENLLIPMIQRVGTGDMQAMIAGAGLILCGGIVTAAKAAMRGEDPFPHLSIDDGGRKKTSTKEEYYRNVVSLVFNAVDRSGILGIMAEPLQVLSKAGYDPVQVLTGGKESLGRAKSKPITEMLMGPSMGKLQSLFEAVTSTVGLATGVDPLTPQATKDYLAVVPFQNLLPFTLLSNTAFSLLEADDSAERSNRLRPDFGEKTAADFYYDQFKFIEHRLAPLLVETDYSNYEPRTAIVQ